jgi:ParB/RepB/Spo0J family partition protein
MAKKLPPLTRHDVTAPTEDTGTRLPGARLLPVERVQPNPWQPRQHANPERLAELIADVAARGILEPIIVRPIDGDRYEVVAGERRYRAALLAGLTQVPAIVRVDMTDAEAREAALVENLLREDLDIEDEARFIKALYEEKQSLRAVGDAIHKSYQYVNRRLKLLDDPQALLDYRQGLINLDHLIAARTQSPDDIAMDDLPSAAHDDAVTGRNNPGDSGLEEVRFYRSKSAYKPFHKLQLHVRRLSPEDVKPDERPRLRRTLRDLIAELTKLEEALASDTPDPTVELEEVPDDPSTWTVRHNRT